jgi:hypothetical protein
MVGPSPGCADSKTVWRFAIGQVVFSLCAHKHFYCWRYNFIYIDNNIIQMHIKHIKELDGFNWVKLLGLTFMLPIPLTVWHLNYSIMVHTYVLMNQILKKQEFMDFSINLWAYISFWKPRIMHVKSQPQNEFFTRVGFGRVVFWSSCLQVNLSFGWVGFGRPVVVELYVVWSRCRHLNFYLLEHRLML